MSAVAPIAAAPASPIRSGLGSIGSLPTNSTPPLAGGSPTSVRRSSSNCAGSIGDYDTGRMRISINMPLKDSEGNPLDATGVMARARMVEAAGLDGIWMGDGISPGMTRPDALMWLLVACAATDHLEVGTSILQIPLRNPVELAQRFLTLQALTRGRFTVGIGAGSTRSNHESVGVDFEQRFSLLKTDMDTIR